MAEYRDYKFTREFRNSWLDFLDDYFELTMRLPSSDEPDRRRIPRRLSRNEDTEQKLYEDIANLICGAGLPIDAYELQGNKIGPKDPTGDVGECAKIKNFPRDTRPRNVRLQRALKENEKRKRPDQFSEDLLRFL